MFVPDPLLVGMVQSTSTWKRPSLRQRTVGLGVQTVLGAERASSIAFSSTRVLPERLLADGFAFAEPNLEAALGDMLA